jgi:hypothetical protein
MRRRFVQVQLSTTCYHRLLTSDLIDRPLDRLAPKVMLAR